MTDFITARERKKVKEKVWNVNLLFFQIYETKKLVTFFFLSSFPIFLHITQRQYPTWPGIQSQCVVSRVNVSTLETIVVQEGRKIDQVSIPILEKPSLE